VESGGGGTWCSLLWQSHPNKRRWWPKIIKTKSRGKESGAYILFDRRRIIYFGKKI